MGQNRLMWWLDEKAKFYSMFGILLLFIRQDKVEKTPIIIAKVADDLLMLGQRKDKYMFFDEISGRFKASKVKIDDKITFNGWHIEQSVKGTFSCA